MCHDGTFDIKTWHMLAHLGQFMEHDGTFWRLSGSIGKLRSSPFDLPAAAMAEACADAEADVVKIHHRTDTQRRDFLYISALL